MKKRINKFILLILTLVLIFTFSNNVAFADSEKIYLGGYPIGISLQMRGASIVGLTDVITENGVESPAKKSGINSGDIILYIDDTEINNALDIEKSLNDGDKKILTVKRNDDLKFISVKPAKDISGKYKLGVFIRDTVNGIGTITFIKGNKIVSLGHPILDDSGKVLDIISGRLYQCEITGRIKGERGTPGELRGVFTEKYGMGSIYKNCNSGIYGTIDENTSFSKFKEIEIGEGKAGNATILTTIDGITPKEYSISIIKSDHVYSGNKNFVIKINDKELLEKTNGIVQGMSGSPIIQDGKLIGAITHVFINDPTRGFGISIQNMLDK